MKSNHLQDLCLGNRLWPMLQLVLSNKFVRYCAVGASGLLVDIGIFYSLHFWAGIPYIYANLISSHAGIVNNFLLNSIFTFKITNRKKARFVSYYIIALSGIMISSVLLKLFIEEWGIAVLASKLLSLVIITILQFFLNKNLTYKRRNV